MYQHVNDIEIYSLHPLKIFSVLHNKATDIGMSISSETKTKSTMISPRLLQTTDPMNVECEHCSHITLVNGDISAECCSHVEMLLHHRANSRPFFLHDIT